MGARSVSNVPSQALLFMNNQFIATESGEFAQRALAAASLPAQRIKWMYERAFGRPPQDDEVAAIEHFVESRSDDERKIWTDVAQVLFWSPEFIYVP